MSEVEEMEPEVIETNPVEDLINTVADQDFSKAGPTFAEIMQAKIDTALEQEKMAVANQVFNGVDQEESEDESEDDEELDDDITDEEMEDAIDELENEQQEEEEEEQPA